MQFSIDVFTCNSMRLNHEKCLFAGLYLAHIIPLKESTEKIHVSASLLYDYLDYFLFLSVYPVIYLIFFFGLFISHSTICS